ncbi:tetratricopeptide repeat protein [Actinophytocola oryzae]|uniref:Flp pilus assembly protein TadD n=1 Tax=Actinophytocola oryzae TaxID=502181 RepID=A0A4R7VQU0_9PSEU|nr:tetratricopeptide repeat protein [Actinophytocola oryzae]TDV52002.1 Flp pilus assembly protein TadD [Actinophytocola oryzae]
MTMTSDGSIDAVLMRAARLSDEGRLRAAIAVLESALEVDPGHAVAWCRLSAAYLDIGEARESLDAAKRAMALGEPAWAHRLASLSLLELGRYEEAVVSAAEAVRREPDDWRGLVILSEALAHQEPEQAVQAARAAVERAPTEPRTHEVLGDAAMLAHDWMLAETAYQDAVRLDPSNRDVTAKLHRVVSRPGDDPRRKRRPVRSRSTPKFERVHRVSWYLAVRRPAVWQALGVAVLLLASSASFLAWYGLGVFLFVGLRAWRGWTRLPDGAAVTPAVLYSKLPLAAVSAGALALSAVSLLVWTVLVALGPVVKPLLLVALVSALIAVIVPSAALRRMWTR